MNIKVYCKQCHKPLGECSITFFKDAFMGELVEGGRKAFCNQKCYSKYLKQYFVKEYKGNNIYWIFRDNQKFYIPYLGCNYGFKTVKDLEEFTDNRALEMKTKWKGNLAKSR